jgi:hypothetical protein
MTAPADGRSPEERIADVERILFEMREAVREALAQNRRAGNSVAVWRNGRVEWIAADEIPDDGSNAPPGK